MPRHEEQKILPFTPEQLYQLVADIEKYPEFLPWCVGATILEQTKGHIDASLVVGYKFIQEKFTSHVKLHPLEHKIDVQYKDGPFKFLYNHWRFIPLKDGTTCVDFFLDFEFSSTFFELILDKFFTTAVKKMIHAFHDRAIYLYSKNPN